MSPEPKELALVAEGARLLAEARTLDEVRSVADVAEVARLYAKKARLGLDAQNCAAAIRQEAEAKAGELLAKTELSRGGRPRKYQSPVASGLPTLEELGVTADESGRFKAVAAVPAERRAEYVVKATERGEEVTRAGLLRYARAPWVTHNSGDVEWYSPSDYFEAARATMGAIDLDPASCIEANAVIKAQVFYTAAENGLAQAWYGRVWLNPPYTQRLVRRFAEKLMAEVAACHVRQACVLVNNATETTWFRLSRIDGAIYICMSSKEWPTLARVRIEEGAH